MDNKIKTAIVILIIMALSAGLYFALVPQYKSIEMSGFTFEVPNSNAEVKNNTINYNTYLDTEHNLNIKTWSCKDLNDVNGTVNASIEMGVQLGENLGANVSHNNISIYNKSGTYTYYDPDIEGSCIILITCDDLDTLDHILETMEKPKLNVDASQFNMESSGLIITNPGSNDTTSKTLTNTSQKSSSKSSSAKKTGGGSSSDTIYGEEITERHDFMGDPDLEYLGTNNNIYIRDKNTGKVAKRELDRDTGVYDFVPV